mgnify:CR=1 FL=1
MEVIHLNPGETLYREGDESDHVYFIEAGAVEVRRGSAAALIPLATLGKGEILGEMGVIRGAPRSVTLVASTPVSLLKIQGASFLKAFGGADDVPLKLLRMICDRLSGANTTGATVGRDKAKRQNVAEIRLLGANRETQSFLGSTGIPIYHLPFEIGLAAGDTVILQRDRLELPVPGPSPQLGPGHFRIELGADGALSVRDLESQLGCIVNGRRISSFERIEQGPVAMLNEGDNEIIAGGIYSSVRFILSLHSKAHSAA